MFIDYSCKRRFFYPPLIIRSSPVFSLEVVTDVKLNCNQTKGGIVGGWTNSITLYVIQDLDMNMTGVTKRRALYLSTSLRAACRCSIIYMRYRDVLK